MRPYSNKVSEGRKTATVRKLKTMPLTRFKPRSAPIWNCMTDKAAKPKSVVMALEAMVGTDFKAAWSIASLTSGVSKRCAAKACSRKIA